MPNKCWWFFGDDHQFLGVSWLPLNDGDERIICISIGDLFGVVSMRGNGIFI